MSRSVARKIYSDVLAKWPKQDLRPDYQFQDAVGQVVEQRFQTYKPSMEAEELLKARALQYLQQNRFKQRYELKGPMLKPTSQPSYFEDLVREIDEAPKRSWFERLGKRISGMVRLQ